ncbi:MAG: hypothetical protein QXZ70_06780 [Candidatus Bathyarchaeia archaeon]
MPTKATTRNSAAKGISIRKRGQPAAYPRLLSLSLSASASNAKPYEANRLLVLQTFLDHHTL